MDITNKKMLFLGDSITEGQGTTSIDKVYWKQFELNDNCKVFGYGIGGTRIARQQVPKNDITDRYFLSRVPEMEEDADVIVVFGGTNDYGHGDAAMGNMESRTDDTFYGALHNLYSALIKRYPNSQLVVMTPCHRLYENKEYNELGTRNVGTLKDYVDAILNVCEYYGIPVLDLYKVATLKPEIEINKEIYMPDGLHPSDEGHKIIYQRLNEFLKTI